jgi:molybdopterin converting factor small subunit
VLSQQTRDVRCPSFFEWRVRPSGLKIVFRAKKLRKKDINKITTAFCIFFFTTMASDGDKQGFSITILLFASAREAAGGVGKVTLDVDADCNTSTIRTILAELYPKLAATVLDEDSLTLALNEEYVASGQVLTLKAGDTIALIPPISGG